MTVFGGDGFIGRYVCEFLMRSGVRVRVASRDPRNSYFIQPLSQVGQLGVVKADVRNPTSVKRAIEAASAVINLTGVFGRQMWGVHVEGAGNVAKAAREEGCAALVHISAIGADPESASNYGRTKAEGEAAVRKAFPKSTIIRPSLVFGPEDQLTNRFAAMAQSTVPAGDRGQARLPAGLCPRPRAGDRQGSARARRSMAARPMRSAARRC